MNIVKPIKNIEKIELMKIELEKREIKGDGEKRIFEGKRNRTIFCTGINSALRVSDIRTLDIKDVFNEDLSLKDVWLKEQKTKKGKEFPITNTLKVELMNYIDCYFYIKYRISIKNIKEDEKELVKEVIRTKPLFPSGQGEGYLTRKRIWEVLNEAGGKLGLERIGTHTMRKTFGYWFYKRTKDIYLLQRILNHSSPEQTMRYIDLSQDEINEAYRNFGL